MTSKLLAVSLVRAVALVRATCPSIKSWPTLCYGGAYLIRCDGRGFLFRFQGVLPGWKQA
jgi:hypothetical protein